MISARHTAWADWIFQPYLTRLFSRHFEALRLLGETPKIEARLPLLLLPNHSTWWDGFFIYLLNKKIFRRRAFVMMLEAQLQLYPFFKYVGVFSVEPSSPAGVRASIRYAAQLLQQKKPPLPLLCIFPQGELQSWRQRPLAYKRGFELILRACGESVNLLPLAIRAEFLGRQRPEVFFCLGRTALWTRNQEWAYLLRHGSKRSCWTILHIASTEANAARH
jgi:1-acyl-sn-glycerol-3-phosphate acyltransferase